MTRGKTPRQCIVLNSLFDEMHVSVDRHSNMNIPVTDVLKQLGFKDTRAYLENDSSRRQIRDSCCLGLPKAAPDRRHAVQLSRLGRL